MQINIGQNLSVPLDTALLQHGDELIVVQPILPGGRTDTDNPQPAEVALANFSIAVSVAESLFDRFFSKFVQLALVEVVTLRKAEKFLAAVIPPFFSFYSRHRENPLF